MYLYFFFSRVVAVLFISTAINGNQVKSNKLVAQSIGRQLKRGRFLCQVSSSTTLYITFCYKEKQLCDTSTGVARCICAEGWRGPGCQERMYEPPSILPTKMPTLSRIGGTCNESSDCATINTGCFQGQCRCVSGFTPRKGNCINIDECKDSSNTCSRNAECIDTSGSYECSCKDGFFDANPNLPGRNCLQRNECQLGMHNCDAETQVCVDRRPPEKWECVEKTPAPTPKPTPLPTTPPTLNTVTCSASLKGVYVVRNGQCVCETSSLPNDLMDIICYEIGTKVYYIFEKVDCIGRGDVCALF